ncbi:MAG: hypothetical protein FWG89_04310 [Treponema sp.]|nr:hypothetical protein [Treponema sp.]
MGSVIGQQWEIYDFEEIKDMVPRRGEIVMVTNTPDHIESIIQLTADGAKDINQLYSEWKNFIALTVASDSTLTGNGTAENPLGVANIGQPGGFATLDGEGKVPATQLPPGGGGTGQGEYTFVVDSDDALRAWADNDPGNDYSRVLIKAGVWTLNTEITTAYHDDPVAAVDISNGRTLSVTGEDGSKLIFNNTSSNSATRFAGIRGKISGTWPRLINPGREFYFDNVSVEVHAYINVDYREYAWAYGFYNCSNLTNCASIAQSYTGNYDDAFGFYNCANLTNCTGSGTGGGTSSGVAAGFLRCSNLSNCSGTGEDIGPGSDSESGGRGFHTCFYLTNCTGMGRSNSYYGSGFYLCSYLANCDGTGEGSNFNYSHGFHGCTNLVNCAGAATFSGIAGGYSFGYCRTGFGCRRSSGGNTLTVFDTCVMDPTGYTTPWGVSAAGGWNNPN